MVVAAAADYFVNHIEQYTHLESLRIFLSLSFVYNAIAFQNNIFDIFLVGWAHKIIIKHKQTERKRWVCVCVCMIARYMK